MIDSGEEESFHLTLLTQEKITHAAHTLSSGSDDDYHEIMEQNVLF